jgi:hypothetical protein
MVLQVDEFIADFQTAIPFYLHGLLLSPPRNSDQLLAVVPGYCLMQLQLGPVGRANIGRPGRPG